MRNRPVRLAILAVALTITALPFFVSTARAQSSWLDAPLANWNTRGMAVPAAPPTDFGGNDSFCAGQARPAETAEDNALVSAGWTLFGTYQSGWGVRIVGARVGLDGMCRPMDYQFFVFVGGRFAGTVSPVAMGSRLDGSAGPPMMSSGGINLDVSFARYAPSDPLCCPSATTTLSYHVDTIGTAPLLVPDSASTNQNS